MNDSKIEKYTRLRTKEIIVIGHHSNYFKIEYDMMTLWSIHIDRKRERQKGRSAKSGWEVNREENNRIESESDFLKCVDDAVAVYLHPESHAKNNMPNKTHIFIRTNTRSWCVMFRAIERIFSRLLRISFDSDVLFSNRSQFIKIYFWMT